MDAQQKKLAGVLVLLVVVAIAVGFFAKSAMVPGETVTDFKRVPPKGIGKVDRG